MRHIRFLAVTLFIVTVPIFLIASNVRWVINAPILYSYGFDTYETASRTGIERKELLSAGGQIRRYFNDKSDTLTVKVVKDGILLQNLYKEREVRHMQDVKGLVQGVYRIHEGLGAFTLAFIVAGLLGWRLKFMERLAYYLAYGACLTVALIIAVGLASLAGFERLFLAFHQVGFSNDLWLLDPRTDYLLAMFPEAFFFDATLWIAGATVVSAIIVAMPCAVIKCIRWRTRHTRLT